MVFLHLISHPEANYVCTRMVFVCVWKSGKWICERAVSIRHKHCNCFTLDLKSFLWLVEVIRRGSDFRWYFLQLHYYRMKFRFISRLPFFIIFLFVWNMCISLMVQHNFFFDSVCLHMQCNCYSHACAPGYWLQITHLISLPLFWRKKNYLPTLCRSALEYKCMFSMIVRNNLYSKCKEKQQEKSKQTNIK